MKQNIWIFDLNVNECTFQEYYDSYHDLCKFAEANNITIFELADRQFILSKTDAVLLRLGGFHFDDDITTIQGFVDFLLYLGAKSS